MSKQRYTVSILLLLTFSMVSATEINSGLEQALTNNVIAYFDLDTTNTKVEIRKSRIRPDNITFDSLVISTMTERSSWKHPIPRGLVSLKAELYQNGEPVADGQIRVCIRHYSDVLVSDSRIRRNHSLSKKNYKIKRMEITSLTETPLTSEDEVTGHWTRRSIRAGQILTIRMFEQIPTIHSGQGVAILYNSSGLKIITDGTALQSGHNGAVIKVRNNQSNKIIACTILDSETVRVATH